MKRIAILIVLLLAASVFAEQPALVVTADGYYFVVLDAGGKPQLEPVAQVIRLGAAPRTPMPDDPDTPDVEIDNDISRQAAAWAKEVGEPRSAQAVAIVYEIMGREVQHGSLDTSNVWNVLVVSTDTALTAEDALAAWKPWRAKVSALTTELTAQGRLTTAKQVELYLLSVASGLRQSVPESAEPFPPQDALRLMGVTYDAVRKARGE